MPDYLTKILLHCNGEDGQKSMVDSSYYNRDLTFYNDAQLDTADKRFGESSLLVDVSGDYVSAPASVDWDFGSVDFTIDLWVKWDESPVYSSIFAYRGLSGKSWTFEYNQGYERVQFNFNNPSGTLRAINWSWIPTGYTWYHLAVVRNGSSWYFFVNGEITGGVKTQADTIGDRNDKPLEIAGRSGGTWWFPGWIDEFRIRKGIAQWTSNFTPPSSEYDYTDFQDVAGSSAGLSESTATLSSDCGFEVIALEVSSILLSPNITINIIVLPSVLEIISNLIEPSAIFSDVTVLPTVVEMSGNLLPSSEICSSVVEIATISLLLSILEPNIIGSSTITPSVVEIVSGIGNPVPLPASVVALEAINLSSNLLNPSIEFDHLLEISSLEISSNLLNPSITVDISVSVETLNFILNLGIPLFFIHPFFPILAAKPNVSDFGHQILFDNIHRTEFESGAPLTRPIFTKAPKRWSIGYVLSNTDKEVLENWEKNIVRYGGLEFVWTNPKNLKRYVAVLEKSIDYAIHPQSRGNLWNVSFNLVTLKEA